MKTTSQSRISTEKKAGQTAAESVLDLFGNTPLVQIRRIVPENGARLFVKLESYSPGGSVKDRVTLHMIEEAERAGLLNVQSVIVEPTSGNTGIGLALICAVKGYKCIITMPESMSLERTHLLQMYGAEIVLTPAREGMQGAVNRADEIIKKNPRAFSPNQYKNSANPDAHRLTTAREILGAVDGRVDAFVAGVGTGGTLTGVGEVLKEEFPGCQLIAVEPETSAVLSGGPPGQHRIQGIGAGFIPEVLNRSVIDKIVKVKDEDAFLMTKRLAREEGILAGISSGANLWAAERTALELGAGSTVVTVCCDTGERYFSVSQYFHF